MKKTIYLLMSLWVTLVACNAQWNEHYSEKTEVNEIEGASPLSLYEYMKTIPQYSEFVKLI